jgi:hypothetical protein
MLTGPPNRNTPSWRQEQEKVDGKRDVSEMAAEHGCRSTLTRRSAAQAMPLGGPHQILDARSFAVRVKNWVSTCPICRDRRVGCETREKVHNRRRSLAGF